MNLVYRPHARIEELKPGECTIHRCGDASHKRWWLLWFFVQREDNGELEAFAVPVNPHGSYTESGPGGRTWGLQPAAEAGTWQVSPSINVLVDSIVDGARRAPSRWHQTPTIVDVPDGEPWQ